MLLVLRVVLLEREVQKALQRDFSVHIVNCLEQFKTGQIKRVRTSQRIMAT